jgi:hypothetical protein
MCLFELGKKLARSVPAAHATEVWVPDWAAPEDTVGHQRTHGINYWLVYISGEVDCSNQL